jgi:hypothetical protein
MAYILLAFFLMSMQLDSNQIKESQRQSWDSVSEGWQKWWKTYENGAYNISSKLVELTNISGASGFRNDITSILGFGTNET